MQKYAGIAMLVGAITFVVGAFQPAVNQVFGAANDTEALAALENSAAGWDIGNLLFGLGGLIAAVSIILLTSYILSREESPAVRGAAVSSAVLVGTGALLWSAISIDRIVQSPEEVIFGSGFGEPWIFPLYSVLTLVGLTLMGVALAKTDRSRWLGWVVTGFYLFLSIKGIINWDTIPFEWYAPMSLIGIVLIIQSFQSQSPAHSQTELAT